MKVIVTGAAEHLGRTVLWELGQRAADVAACSRAGALPEWACGIGEPGGPEPTCLALDIASETAG